MIDHEVHLTLVTADESRLEQSQVVGRLQDQLGGRLRGEGFAGVAKSLRRVREDNRTQDLGVTLGIVLGTPAIIAVAVAKDLRGNNCFKAVVDWAR